MSDPLGFGASIRRVAQAIQDFTEAFYCAAAALPRAERLELLAHDYSERACELKRRP